MIGANTVLSQIESKVSEENDAIYRSSSFSPCDRRDLMNLSVALVEAEKMVSPGKTVHGFLSEIAYYVNSTVGRFEEPYTTEDIDDIIADGHYLCLSDMLVHTFEVDQLVRFSVGKFGHGQAHG